MITSLSISGFDLFIMQNTMLTGNDNSIITVLFQVYCALVHCLVHTEIHLNMFSADSDPEMICTTDIGEP